ncbi:MAG: MerR family transcriptional regulator [Myxococcales bacterium]|nr:MerR family transcriptional regulator [Myxococcales bacterium]
MNLTLTIDDALAEHASAVAATRGKSLGELVRELLEAATGLHDGAARVQELEALWASSTGDAKGQRMRREDAYQDRVK